MAGTEKLPTEPGRTCILLLPVARKGAGGPLGEPEEPLYFSRKEIASWPYLPAAAAESPSSHLARDNPLTKIIAPSLPRNGV